MAVKLTVWCLPVYQLKRKLFGGSVVTEFRFLQGLLTTAHTHTHTERARERGEREREEWLPLHFGQPVPHCHEVDALPAAGKGRRKGKSCCLLTRNDAYKLTASIPGLLQSFRCKEDISANRSPWQKGVVSWVGESTYRERRGGPGAEDEDAVGRTRRRARDVGIFWARRTGNNPRAPCPLSS